jgi:hypothetical protein
MTNEYKQSILNPRAMKPSTPMLTSSSLPTLPGYVFRLNQLLSEAKPDVLAVVKVIRTDASLTAQALRISNLYRLEREASITTVAEAVEAIGAKRLRTMVITCPLLDCAGNATLWTSLQSFWQHNFMTAALSESIALFLDLEKPETAYTAGLLRNIGELSLIAKCHVDGSAWPVADNTEDSATKRSKEAGRRLAIACKFTPEFVEACSCDDPARAWHDPLLVKIVTAARRFCEINGLISGGAPRQLTASGDDSKVPKYLAELFKLSPRRATDLATALTYRFRSLMCGLEFNQAGLLEAASTEQLEVGPEAMMLASA